MLCGVWGLENKFQIFFFFYRHRGPEEWWSRNATIEDWFDEMVGQANIINKFGNVRMEDLRGMRVPFLRVGWNRQFLMMKEFGFVYDSSMIAPISNPPLWPYTMDYKMPHKCSTGQYCPSRSYPGIWEMVINELIASDGDDDDDDDDYTTCGTIDSCPQHFNEADVYTMFIENFNRHYLSNRAPFGLYFHSTWFKKLDNYNAFIRFLNDLTKLDDVYFVTNYQAIQWMQQPTPINELNQFKPWHCDADGKQFDKFEIACKIPNTCKLQSRVLQQERYFYTCNECPAQYPWIRNEFGLD